MATIEKHHDIERNGVAGTNPHTDAAYHNPTATSRLGNQMAGENMYIRKIANPAPLGLYSFASTTLILSFYNVSLRGINTPNVVVGMALGVGGLAQLLAGMWEFATGNTFGATAFTSYGAFWISFALIYWPGSGVLAAYSSADKAPQLHNALGVYLMSWFIFTFLLFLATLRTTGALSALFFFLTLTFMLLMIGEFMENAKVHKAGGALGIVTAFIAYYLASAGLYTPQQTYFTIPVVDLPKRRN